MTVNAAEYRPSIEENFAALDGLSAPFSTHAPTILVLVFSDAVEAQKRLRTGLFRMGRMFHVETP